MTARRARAFALAATALVAILLLPLKVYPVLALDILLWGVFAVSVDLLLGFGGLLSFGQAAFWGSGGYTAAVLASRFHVAFPLAVLGSLVFATSLALPIGYLSIRTRGIYFAMVTLAFGEMVFYLVNEWRPVTGGENGIQGIPRLFPGLDLNNATTYYYAALPLVIICYAAAYRIVHSPFGHVLVSIRDNEPRAQALGYATSRYKLLGFMLAAALAGTAGGIHTIAHGTAGLDLVDWTTSGTAVIMTILGGIGTIWGSVFGAAVVLLLQDWLSTTARLTDATGVVTGALFIVIVLGLRRGIWGTVAMWLKNGRRGPEPEPLAPRLGDPRPASVVPAEQSS
ncbi:MAG TPA: branched-chain amino acid ABC transporter permease [Chloroflexota bacterium]